MVAQGRGQGQEKHKENWGVMGMFILFGMMASHVYSTGQNVRFTHSFSYVNHSSTRLLKRILTQGYLTPKKKKKLWWAG